MTESDAAFARRIAGEAGALLLDIRRTGGDPASLRARGDAEAQDFLAHQLTTHRPADAVLSEEAVDDHARLSARRVWIIDPLDGTREFGEPDRADWAVHVALWQDGALAAGAVAMPALAEVFGTEPPAARPPRHTGPMRIVVSRTRPPDVARRVADTLGADLVPLGSAGAKAMAVVRGDVEAYLHDGGQHEWDSAAPVAVARAAGLHTCRLDGSELTYNNADPYLPDLLICLPEHADAVLGTLAEVRA